MFAVDVAKDLPGRTFAVRCHSDARRNVYPESLGELLGHVCWIMFRGFDFSIHQKS